MFRVTARAPTRIDLAGGTLDLWPIHHLLDHKATVNVGVSLDATVEIDRSPDAGFHFRSQDQRVAADGSFTEIVRDKKLPLLGLLTEALWRADLPPISLTTAAGSPAGAGLGGSSCLGVAVAAALCRARQLIGGEPPLQEDALVRVVQDVEARLIHAPTGVQDYWGGVRGRINVLRFPYGRLEVATLAPSQLIGLSDQLILCYSGKSRASAINNWEIFKRLFDGDRDLLAIFNHIGAAAENCATAIMQGDLDAVLRWSREEWLLRVRLWPNIETVETKTLDAAALKAGAKLTRVCGAGGGGVMAVFAAPEAAGAVRTALEQHGGEVLDAGVADYGLTVRP